MTVAGTGWGVRLSLLLVGTMAAAPFLEPRHYPLFRHFYSEWSAAALGLAAGAALFAGGALARGFAVPRIAVIPAGLMAIALLQLALQQPVYPAQTLVFMLYLIWAALLAVVGHALAATVGLARVMRALAWGLLAGGLASALSGVLQLIDAGPAYGLVAQSQAVGGNLAQPNHFADQLWLACAAALYLFADGRLNRAYFVVAASVLLALSILSTSRSVFLYLIALVALSLAWQRRAAGADERKKRLFAGAVAVLGLFVLLQLILAGSGFPTGAARLSDVSGTSIRLRLWQTALDIFFAHPLLGAGIGQFSWQTFLAGLSWDGVVAEHAHNVVMQLLAEMGIFAALLVAAALLAWLGRVLRQTPDTACWFALAVLAVVGIHSQLEYPLWYTYFLGPFALVLGAADPRGHGVRAARAVRIALVAVLLLGAVLLAEAIDDYAQLRSGALPAPERLEKLRRNMFFTAHLDLRLAAAMPLSGEARAEKLAVCRDALRFYPIWQVAYKCALLHALEGEAGRAASLWRLAGAAFPGALPAVIDELRRMPEARDGVPAALLAAGEQRLAELQAKGVSGDGKTPPPRSR